MYGPSEFEALEQQPIDTLYRVAGMARERREQFRPVFYRQLTAGVAYGAALGIASALRKKNG